MYVEMVFVRTISYPDTQRRLTVFWVYIPPVEWNKEVI